MSKPSVDVIIPTFNCESNLRTCLSRLRSQDYSGDLRLVVVDGGSVDGTTLVAQAFGAELHVNPGQYGVGIDGARHFAETRSTADILWYIDSDNFVVGSDVTTSLVRPFEEDSQVQISVPFIKPEPDDTSFNNWVALVELENLRRTAVRGGRRDGWTCVADLTYGISNASMVRRESAIAGGGFDSDVRLLARLRLLGRARAALVPSARYTHRQAKGALDFMAKWSRRVRRAGNMTPGDIQRYFAQSPVTLGPLDRVGVPGSPFDMLCGYPLQGLFMWVRARNSTWLWGVCYPVLFGSTIARHPFGSLRAWRNFH
jgi:GT2 family glycosyltransferase